MKSIGGAEYSSDKRRHAEIVVGELRAFHPYHFGGCSANTVVPILGVRTP